MNVGEQEVASSSRSQGPSHNHSTGGSHGMKGLGGGHQHPSSGLHSAHGHVGKMGRATCPRGFQ